MPLNFFALVFALAIAFWTLGYLVPDTRKFLLIKLPISTLITFCPLIASAMLVHKKQRLDGINQLLKLSFDFKRIKNKERYTPNISLMPGIALLLYWYMKIIVGILPEPRYLSCLLSFFLLNNSHTALTYLLPSPLSFTALLPKVGNLSKNEI